MSEFVPKFMVAEFWATGRMITQSSFDNAEKAHEYARSASMLNTGVKFVVMKPTDVYCSTALVERVIL